MIDIALAEKIHSLGLKIESEISHTNDTVFPMPSAEELMNVLPGKIVEGTKAFYLRIHKEELSYHAVYFRIQYVDDKTITYLMTNPIIDESFVNALAKLVIWLIENNYILTYRGLPK